MTRTQRFIELALKLATKSEYYQKVGCVIVKGNRVIGLGFNKPNKTHPMSNNRFHNVHAELDAILGHTAEELEGATAYVARIRNNGTVGLAKPCEHCQELLKRMGIKTVIYTKDMNGYDKL
jgi:deoxycytidylate deaminase